MLSIWAVHAFAFRQKKPGLLNRSGGLSELSAEFEWSATFMGPIESWPAYVAAVTSFALNSDLLIVMLWSQRGVMVYNDAMPRLPESGILTSGQQCATAHDALTIVPVLTWSEQFHRNLRRAAVVL